MRSWWCFWGWGGGCHPQTHQLGPPQPHPSPDLDPHRRLRRPAGTQIIGFSIPIPPSQRAQLGGPPLSQLYFCSAGRLPHPRAMNILTSSSPSRDAAFAWGQGGVLAETCQVGFLFFGGGTHTLTAANLSKRAKSSLRSFTSSWALQDEESWVKPTMSAKRMLRGARASASTPPHPASPIPLSPFSPGTWIFCSANRKGAPSHGLVRTVQRHNANARRKHTLQIHGLNAGWKCRV